MEIIGRDKDGITSISLKAIEEIAEKDYKSLKSVTIEGKSTTNVECHFIFDDDTVYVASGFSIGYGGEGPRGLHRALCIFDDRGISRDFYSSPISKLDINKKWSFTPGKGFSSIK